jgi:hypothetical protein
MTKETELQKKEKEKKTNMLVAFWLGYLVFSFSLYHVFYDIKLEEELHMIGYYNVK